MDRQYVYKYCSPTRSGIQSGRHPFHVNPLNAAPDIHNPLDPVSGFAAIPRNMTGIGTKMSAAGYKTFMAGKWDAGMATMDHTPRGRGYSQSIHYFHHDNDYWDSDTGTCDTKSIHDLWLNKDGREGPASTIANNCPWGANPTEGMGSANYNYSYVVGKSCTLGPQGDRWWNGYEDSIFQQHVLQFIEESTPSDPLFIFWAPHIVHTPLQVPEEYFRMFDFVEATDKATHERQR